MAQKVPGFNTAYGYWGSNPRRRIIQEQVPQRVLAWTQDKILSMGQPVALFEECPQVGGLYMQCSCFKDTSKQPDITCRSCYGVGRIPGYQRFGMKYLWAASTTPGWTFNNTFLATINSPNMIELSPTALSGTAISAQFAINTTGIKGNFQTDITAFPRDPFGTIVLEFSSVALAAPPVWQPINNLLSISALPFPYIQFRVTMTRPNLNAKTPLFEIFRMRWPVLGDIIPASDGGLNEPVIRVLQTWEDETLIRADIGERAEGNQTMFTCPMTFFDPTRTGQASVIVSSAFIERRYSHEIGKRFPLFNFKYSEQFGILTRQQFEVRIAQGDGSAGLGEIYHRVF